MAMRTSKAMRKDSFEELKQEEQMMSLVSYNVLYAVKNKILRLLLDPERRFRFQFDEMFPKLNADIYCLQEVTTEYIEMMEKSKFYKEGFSHTPPDEKRINNHFPMILTKLPFKLLLNEDRVVI